MLCGAGLEAAGACAGAGAEEAALEPDGDPVEELDGGAEACPELEPPPEPDDAGAGSGVCAGARSPSALALASGGSAGAGARSAEAAAPADRVAVPVSAGDEGVFAVVAV